MITDLWTKKKSGFVSCRIFGVISLLHPIGHLIGCWCSWRGQCM